MDALLGGFGISLWPGVKTPFVGFLGEYAAECRTSGDATYLLVTRATGPSDVRPGLPAVSRRNGVSTVLDVNLALGNLVVLVESQAAAYAAAAR